MPTLGKGGFRTFLIFFFFFKGILEALDWGDTSFLSKHFSGIWYTSSSVVGVGG